MLHLVYVVLRIEPRASCLLSQQPTSRAPPRVLHALYLFLQEKAVVGSTGSCLRECWEAISRQHSWNHTAPLQAPSTENAKKQKQKTKTEQNQQQQQQQQKEKCVESNEQPILLPEIFFLVLGLIWGPHQASSPTDRRCSPKGPVPGRQHQPVPSPTKNHRHQTLPLTTFFTK